MQLKALLLALLVTVAPPLLAKGPASAMTDAQVKAALIERSINNYSGNCPCPYNSASNGSRCGARSAYSRPGGASPLCFPEDVTPQMVADFRARSR